jgi:predicted MarR family transcription regulator
MLPKLPQAIFLITDNTQQDCLLFHLINLQGNNKSCYASLSTLCKYLHTTHTNTIEKSIKALVTKGFITYIKGSAEKNLANEYTVNIEAIVLAIKVLETPKYKSQYSPKQKKKI